MYIYIYVLYPILRQTYLDACLGRTWDDCRIPSDRLNNASWFGLKMEPGTLVLLAICIDDYVMWILQSQV